MSYGISSESSSERRNCWQTTRPILTAPCRYLRVMSSDEGMTAFVAARLEGLEARLAAHDRPEPDLSGYDQLIGGER